MIKNLIKKSRIYLALQYAYDQYMHQQSRNADIAKIRHIGEGSEVFPNVTITYPSRLWIGDHTLIQNDTFLHTMGGLHIGNYVGIGYGTRILTFNHSYRSSEEIPYDTRVELKPVVIRDYVWFGWNCKIYPGLEIGEGAIVALGSVITTNIPPLSIVMGNPAKVIGRRSEEHFEKCKREGRIRSHRIPRDPGFIESVPLVTRRRYAKELKDLGLWED